MVFSSITFLIYFLPLFFLVYFLIPDRFKNGWLVLASLLFYCWGAPLFVGVVMLSCAIDFFLALRFRSRNGRLYFIIAIITNVVMLVYFKYANFFVENFNYMAIQLTGQAIPWSKVILPIGISFLTFQKISFLTDVYRKDAEPQKSYWNYLLFVILFPHLIAGPIVRFKEISWQITNRFHEIIPVNIYLGLVRFIIGLSKKVLIANIMGDQANQVFDLPDGSIDFTKAWVGILAYAFQIYFDFSGYSDMAIGIAKMAGFRIPENFNFPYTSRSITEFWKRWHITLGSWMKDYLYIPLGGNRVAVRRVYFNLFTVFLLSGLWHGASWNFVIWGAFHGLFLVAERIGLSRLLKKAGTPISVIYAFVVVVTGWVFFRSTDLEQALAFLHKMYSSPVIDGSYLLGLNARFLFVAIAALLFSFMPDRAQERLNSIYAHGNHRMAVNIAVCAMVLILYALNLGELYATGFNPFIYFKF